MVQQRTLRSHHGDAHYCAKNYKNLRQYGVFLKNKLVEAGSDNVAVTFVSSDDKAKVSVAKPFHKSVSHFAFIALIAYMLLRACLDRHWRTTLANKHCSEGKSIDLPSTL